MEIIPGVHAVPGIRWSRIYLIEGDTLALVDTGLPWSAQRVFNYIESIGRKPEELDTILMTHSHPDHTGGALKIIERTGAEIIAHADDTRRHSDETSLSYMGMGSSLRAPLPFLRRTPVSRLVSDGQVLPMLGGIRVIHTPGHTPGSVCYLLENRGLLFSGDTAFSNGERVSRSVPFPGYNKPDYLKSLERLASLEFDTLCGGHGVPLVGGASDRLKELLATRPEPPSWWDFFKSMPRRVLKSRGMSGEF
ncbi:MAG: MBL fold metallo-hydrolase [Chloroflexi bacterium]|nr:MBL fold metallo-hydrolase [Chloroflexota bacterium]